MSDFDMQDELYKNDLALIQEIRKLIHKQFYSAPSYCVMLDGQVVVHTDSDYIDAANVCDLLLSKYPDKKFYISNEHVSFQE